MDSDPFTASLFKWDPRGGMVVQPSRTIMEPLQSTTQQTVCPVPATNAAAAAFSVRQLGGLEELFQAYGIRYYTAAKIAELGFTVSTLLDMKDDELDEMMNSLCQIFRFELLVGERYGIKAAVRAHRRRLVVSATDTPTNALDALSQEGLSEEPVQEEKEVVGSGGGGMWEVVAAAGERRKKQRRSLKSHRRKMVVDNNHENGDQDADDEEEEDDDNNGAGNGNGNGNGHGGGGINERQREHPFIVTEPGEVARGKKNGLDYLFHLYEQCRDFLIQVQNIAKDRGEKCPTKVLPS